MRDIGAFARKQHRDGPADAGIAAGDQRHLAVEFFEPSRRARHTAAAGRSSIVARLRLVLLREGRLGILSCSGLHCARVASVFFAARVRPVHAFLDRPLFSMSCFEVR